MDTITLTRDDLEQWLIQRHPTKDISTLIRFLEMSGRIQKTILGDNHTDVYVIDEKLNNPDYNKFNTIPIAGDIVLSFDTGTYLVVKKENDQYVEALMLGLSSDRQLGITPQPPKRLSISDLFFIKHSDFDMTVIGPIVDQLIPQLKEISKLWTELINCKERKI